ncbi:hypothetical protein OH76DRAFT_441857 [Lentinus brumalis]|uniref:F-box domain-containing protein n=1 Tax=Lentinus brumalis TaxID=2498619 RepID=A0A371DE40_9APHY|nr:hypothetical protein OH76DRAFT_441857 [Polyporus brumalis]
MAAIFALLNAPFEESYVASKLNPLVEEPRTTPLYAPTITGKDHAYLRLLAFPVEILDFIFQELEYNHLPPIIRVNTLFHTIATRILYRVIPELPLARCIKCLKVLCSTPANAVLVRKLSIDWAQHRVVSNLFRLLRDTLTHLTNLRHLSIELSPQDNHYGLAWVLDGLRSQLKTLGTSIRCDSQLAAVLETQPELIELCLRGFQTKQPFTLSASAMPNLRSFRAVHAGPSVISAVVKGRPVEAVSLSMFLEDGCQPLDSLLLSTCPIKRLTIMSLDSSLAPNVLLPEVARRMPELEALHVVVLMAMFDNKTLQESGPSLKKFSDLRYLTFMAAGSASIEDEGQIARAWSKACPTLRTIILPKGKVWFERDGQWTCCG